MRNKSHYVSDERRRIRGKSTVSLSGCGGTQSSAAFSLLDVLLRTRLRRSGLASDWVAHATRPCGVSLEALKRKEEKKGNAVALKSAEQK